MPYAMNSLCQLNLACCQVTAYIEGALNKIMRAWPLSSDGHGCYQDVMALQTVKDAAMASEQRWSWLLSRCHGSSNREGCGHGL
jgi:hypothetical protein